MSQFQHLFQPIQVGPMRVPNRICETTNTINSSRSRAESTTTSSRTTLAKAKGGTGWIGSETWLLNVAVSARDARRGRPLGRLRVACFRLPEPALRRGHDRSSTARCTRWVRSRSRSSRISPRCGRRRRCRPSARRTTCRTSGRGRDRVPLRERTPTPPRSPRAAGVDGIEMHCAHETLGYSFLSPVTNRRTDRWGGGPQERIRFVVESARAHPRARGRRRSRSASALAARSFATAATTTSRCARCSTTSARPGSSTSPTSTSGTAGARLRTCRTSYYGHAPVPEYGRAATRRPREPGEAHRGALRGRVNDPVRRGGAHRATATATSSAWCAPASPTRSSPTRRAKGRLSEIRRCISCTRCIDEASEPRYFPYTPICSINPMIGNEVRWKEHYRPTERPKRVVVVGGGLAGSEAARVAAMRGHQVTLLERGKRLGGQLLLAIEGARPHRLRGSGLLRGERDGAHGVEVRLGATRRAAIKALKPDAVVIATGSMPRVPHDVHGLDLPHVVQAWDVLVGQGQTGDRVAVVSQEDYYETPVRRGVSRRAREARRRSSASRCTSAPRSRATRSAWCSRAWKGAASTSTRTSSCARLRRTGSSSCRRSARRPTTEGFDSVVLVYGSVAQPELYDQLKADGSVADSTSSARRGCRASWARRHGTARALGSGN